MSDSGGYFVGDWHDATEGWRYTGPPLNKVVDVVITSIDGTSVSGTLTLLEWSTPARDADGFVFILADDSPYELPPRERWWKRWTRKVRRVR